MDIDLGLVSASNCSVFQDSGDLDSELCAVATRASQAVFNELFALDFVSKEDVVLVRLPPAKMLLPRALAIPVPGPKTRWEKFASAKGIVKKKKLRREFDQKGLLKTRFGFDEKRDKSLVKEDWLLEVPKNSDPLQDQFELKKDQKLELVAKNKRQNLRNSLEKKLPVAEARAILSKSEKKDFLKSEVKSTRVSTASLGVFDKAAHGEEQIKLRREKRKFNSVTENPESERKTTSSLVEKVAKKIQVDGKVLVSKAISHVAQKKFRKSAK